MAYFSKQWNKHQGSTISQTIDFIQISPIFPPVFFFFFLLFQDSIQSPPISESVTLVKFLEIQGWDTSDYAFLSKRHHIR